MRALILSAAVMLATTFAGCGQPAGGPDDDSDGGRISTGAGGDGGGPTGTSGGGYEDNPGAGVGGSGGGTGGP